VGAILKSRLVRWVLAPIAVLWALGWAYLGINSRDSIFRQKLAAVSKTSAWLKFGTALSNNSEKSEIDRVLAQKPLAFFFGILFVTIFSIFSASFSAAEEGNTADQCRELIGRCEVGATSTEGNWDCSRRYSEFNCENFRKNICNQGDWKAELSLQSLQAFEASIGENYNKTGLERTIAHLRCKGFGVSPVKGKPRRKDHLYEVSGVEIDYIMSHNLPSDLPAEMQNWDEVKSSKWCLLPNFLCEYPRHFYVELHFSDLGKIERFRNYFIFDSL
jgi:hypothetical protein